MQNNQREAAKRVLEEAYVGRQYTSDEEILLRLKVAEEIINDAYKKYLQDPSKTREQARNFCDFVLEIGQFRQKLLDERKEKIHGCVCDRS